MILVNEILSWVTGRLDLSKKSDRFVVADFYRYLSDALLKLNREYVALEREDTLLTVKGQAQYDLPTDVRVLRILEVEFPWKENVIETTPQKMRDLKRQMLAGETFSLSQPKFWCAYFKEQPYIELLHQDSILEDDLEIKVRFSYIPRFFGKVIVKSDILQIPEEYQLYICLYVAKSLAPKYKPEETSILTQEFLKEDDDIKRFRTRRQQAHTIHTDVYKF